MRANICVWVIVERMRTQGGAMCVCVVVCMCVREREGERERGRETRCVCVCVCVACACVRACARGGVSLWDRYTLRCVRTHTHI